MSNAKHTLANLSLVLPSPLNPLNWPYIASDLASEGQFTQFDTNAAKDIQLFCKRDDLIHPIISGNKWRKLAPSVEFMLANNVQHVISFGGGYSNHLHALSFVCANMNIKLTAIVRGNYSQNLTPMLIDLQKWQTTIKFVSKETYNKRTDPAYCNNLRKLNGADFVIPEGGSNSSCVEGFVDMVNEVNVQLTELKQTHLTHVVAPVASGGTLAGLVRGFANTPTKVLGIAVLKGKGYLEDLVQGLLYENEAANNQRGVKLADWEILHEYHHGGYAKSSPSLVNFISQFHASSFQSLQHSPPIPSMTLEQVYSGKCFYALNDLLTTQYFADNSNIMIVHTGGLQGAR